MSEKSLGLALTKRGISASPALAWSLSNLARASSLFLSLDSGSFHPSGVRLLLHPSMVICSPLRYGIMYL